MELISYGIYKQDFYSVVKRDNLYILYIAIPLPDCVLYDEAEIIKHIEELENEGTIYKSVFENLQEAFKDLFDIQIGEL